MAQDCDIPCIVCAPPIGASGTGAAKGAAGLAVNDPSNPFVNLSSEGPDVDIFIGNHNIPPGIGDPPLGTNWTAKGCLALCFSTVSQEDADICAQNQAIICNSKNWPPNPPPGTGSNGEPVYPPSRPPPSDPSSQQLFYNTEQSCSFACGDGSEFTYTVRAGYIVGTNQGWCDTYAKNYACAQALSRSVCVTNISRSRFCLNGLLDAFITANTIRANLPIAFEIVGGALPDGVVAAQNQDTLLLSGIVTVAGDYNFTVRATAANGVVINKNFAVTVFGISTSSLPGGTVGTPYSQTVEYAGTPAGTVVFSITSGTLPDGLTLNSSTGEISGTPTTEQNASFSVGVSDGSVQCSKNFTINVVAVSGFDWNAFSWIGHDDNVSGTGAGVQVGVGDTVTGNVFGDFGFPCNCELRIYTDVQNFNDVVQNAKVVVDITGISGQVTFISILRDAAWPGGAVLDVQSSSFIADGTYEFPFTLNGPTPVCIEMVFRVDNTGGISSANMVAQFVNVP